MAGPSAAPTPRLETVALDAVMVRLFDAIDEANMPWLLAATQRLREAFADALIDLVPSYTTVMVHFDIARLSLGAARERVLKALDALEPQDDEQGERHVLPVWYDVSVGPELETIAARAAIAVDEVIRRHAEREYRVFALGFAPGFAFMGLVEPSIATPRLATPRKRIAPGSVGIAERQTAAYPGVSPGGWNLIGRTSARLFDRDRDGYSLLRPGDRVRFEPVGRDEFIRHGGDTTTLEERR